MFLGDLKRGRTFGEEAVDHLSCDFGVEAFELGRLDVATAPLDLLAGMLVEHDVIPHEDGVDPPAWARTTKLEQAANSVLRLWRVWDLAINHELVDVTGHLAHSWPEHVTQLRIHDVSWVDCQLGVGIFISEKSKFVNYPHVLPNSIHIAHPLCL